MLQIDYKSITGNEKGRSMKVIVTIIEDLKDVRVRKCPPNYPTNGEGEFIVELEDYTEDDIKKYFEIDTQIYDKDKKV